MYSHIEEEKKTHFVNQKINLRAKEFRLRIVKKIKFIEVTF